MNLQLKLFSKILSEPRKEKTDSSNGNNNALSPQEQQHQQHQQHQQSHLNMHMMMSSGMGDAHHLASSMKPERPNSFGPKITKRINFYHGDNCKSKLNINLKKFSKINILQIKIINIEHPTVQCSRTTV